MDNTTVRLRLFVSQEASLISYQLSEIDPWTMKIYKNISWKGEVALNEQFFTFSLNRIDNNTCIFNLCERF